MTRRLVAGVLGALVLGAAVATALVLMPGGKPEPTPGDAVQRMASVRTCAEFRADSTTTYWHVFNALNPEPCEDEDIAQSFVGLSFKIDSTEVDGDTAYVMMTRICHRRHADPHCNGQMFYVTVMKVNGVWKVDDYQRQVQKQP